MEKYKHAKKAEISFKPIVSAGTSTSCDAFECPPPSKKSKFSGDISTESHQSVESNEDERYPIQKDIEEQKREKSQLAQLSADSSVDRYEITETDIKGNKEKHVPSSDSEMLAKILQLTTETHAIITQNKKVIEKCSLSSSTPDQGQGKSSLKSNDFDHYIAHLSRCRCMSELLNNQLMKPFNISKKNPYAETEDCSKMLIPDEISNALADDDINMLDVNIGNDGDNEEDGEVTVPDDSADDNFECFLFCSACASSNPHRHDAYAFKVKDENYACQSGKNLERWFINLKRSLIRHLTKLRHHQRLAVYEVISKHEDKMKKNINDICSNLMYYIIRTNTAWALYPVLLAVLFRSGCEVGNLNHSHHACEKFCEILDSQLKKETEDWFVSQKSLTLTADIGTILGLTLLVVLVMSEEDRMVKLIGVKPMRNKTGIYLANEIYIMLKENLNVEEKVIVSKISGMAGDGAFCKDNAPFKEEMRRLFKEGFKFRWDLLHLVNRAHLDSTENVPKIKECLDFVQNHSSEWRTGLDYTNMYLDHIIGFKRPKLKSATRMVNYEYDQLHRFLENSKFFDHPHEKIMTSKYYLLITLTTKIILQVAQKTDVKTKFIKDIFYDAKGKEIMCKLLHYFRQDTLLTEFIKDVKETSSEGSKSEKIPEDYILSELKKYVKKHQDFFQEIEEARGTRTRSENLFTKETAFNWISDYIDKLWLGISERLKHFDSDGSTAWSEAPAEGIFSIMQNICDHKNSIKLSNLTKLCRIIKEGPPPGSQPASWIIQNSIEKWPSIHGPRFTSNNFIKRTTSASVAKVLNS